MGGCFRGVGRLRRRLHKGDVVMLIREGNVLIEELAAWSLEIPLMLGYGVAMGLWAWTRGVMASHG